MSTSRKGSRKPQKSRKGGTINSAVPIPTRLIGNAEKITDRKIGKEKIHKSETLLAQAEQLANLGSWEWDLETGAIIWSDNMYRLRGFAPREVALTEEFCSGLLHSADRERGKELLAQAIASGQSGQHEFRTAIKDGSIRVFQTRFSPVISESGKVLRIVGTTQDITEHKLAKERIHKSETLLRRLSQDLINTQDADRRQIARELHESAGQTLAALKMTLANLEYALRENTEEVPRHLQAARAQAEDAIREIRVLSYLMHPPMLDELGLEPTIRWYARGFSERSGIETTFEFDGKITRLPLQVETTIFRIVQEALTNIHRYSGSRTATIRLNGEEGSICVEIKDQGCGLQAPPERTSKVGVGIAGMHERVRQLKGRLEIESVAGQGTVVRAVIPFMVMESGS